jgi:glycosyltransferase involved in cell wall biosynthesis
LQKYLYPNKHMKILLTIHHDLDPNAGAPGVTWQLGQQYQMLGHEVLFYSFDNLPPEIAGKAKSIVFPWFVATHMSRLVKQQNIDVVDASTGDAWVWMKMLKNSTEKPPLLVTRAHGLEHTSHLQNLEESQRDNLHLSWKYGLYGGGFRLWEVATSLRYSDLVFQLNRHDLEYAIEKLGVKPERSHLVDNGVPEIFFNLPFEPAISSRDSTICIAQIGTYLTRKGTKYSVPALNAILARHPQVKVSFLGTGVSEADVHADFEQSVRNRIQVIPFYSHEQLPTLLKGHQIKLFPTLFEGFSVAIIEAMACGLAPVTTAIAAPETLIRDGDNALIIPPRDCQAIEQALERLISDRLYLEQLRRHAHATAQLYSWARIARDTLALYEEALYKKKKS